MEARGAVEHTAPFIILENFIIVGKAGGSYDAFKRRSE